ncbi:MAG: GntR family transcriptional regulator [Algiphilus sp.]|uniref:FadR/GntR family transcriptional regulator n=1 Tax=Algiphilus sp. TaxID=1872431 RepID=UPI0025C2E9A2|nr:GntR family transcriptional regulator [Algiphilus sp.]MCI5062583.1 GntR family transcriptional regulator [Algiphilus sp.]MCI5103642.1 GntR family transcriptional regulator [Algiphilus sp.]
MSLTPLPRASLSEGVFEQLRDRILADQMTHGETLPSERVLAEQLGVNRGAVREGLKRLQQAQLVRVRHGGATEVLDWRRSAGLELLPHLLVRSDGQLHTAAARGIVALRQALAPSVAAAAARRAGGDTADRLDEALRALQAATDAAQRQEQALRYWSVLVDGSNNLGFRLAFNALEQTYRPIWALLRPVLDAEFRDTATLEALNAAVRDGRSADAQRLACAHIEIGSKAMEALLDAHDAADQGAH